jgi:glucosamine-6-phosphate deaminase
MEIICKQMVQECGAAAATEGIKRLKEALAARREANIILATGLSQFTMLATLREAEGVEWERVNAFHLDEYVGISARHPASFRTILWQEFFAKLPVPLKSFTWVDGEAPDPEAECARVSKIISEHPIDVAFIGIGENGHLAFNDPPADFQTEVPYITVTLDEACRKQQSGEGWFKTMNDVPKQAISMSIRQILKSKVLIVTVPDERKAEAVKNSIEGKISNLVPGTVLRTHPDAKLFLDAAAASKLGMAPGAAKTLPIEPMP